jgi:hypothetical protein
MRIMDRICSNSGKGSIVLIIRLAVIDALLVIPMLISCHGQSMKN